MLMHDRGGAGAAAASRCDAPPTRRTVGRLSDTTQLNKVWAALVESADKLSLRRIQLEVDLPWLAEGFHATWEKGPGTEKSWRIDVPVMLETRVVGWLRVIGDSGHAADRKDIAILLDVLDTSESYLQSVFRSQGRGPRPVAAPHSDLRDRMAPSATEPTPAGVEPNVEYGEKAGTSH